MRDDGCDDDSAADERPVGGAFTQKQKDPDGIQDRLDVADYACVQRADAARHAQCEERICHSDLKDSEEENDSEILSGHAWKRH